MSGTTISMVKCATDTETRDIGFDESWKRSAPAARDSGAGQINPESL